MARVKTLAEVVRDPEPDPSWLARQGFRGKGQERVYRKLAQLMRISGIRVRDALEISYDHLSSDGKKSGAPGVRAVAHVAMRMRRGRSFGKAWEGWVTPEHLLLFQAVDKGYPVARALGSAEMIEQNKRKMRKEVMGALRQVAVWLSLVVVMLVITAYALVPQWAEMVPLEEWTGVPAYLAALATFVTGPWMVVVIGGLVVTVVALIWSLPRWTGRLRDALGAVEPWRTYRMVTGVSFLLAFSGLLGTQGNLQVLLRSLMKPSSPWVALKIAGILREARAGKDLGDAMWAADPGWPDTEINRELRVVVKLQDQDKAVRELVEGWVDESVEKVKRLAKGVMFVGMAVVGGLVGFMYYGMYALPQMIREYLTAGY